MINCMFVVVSIHNDWHTNEAAFNTRSAALEWARRLREDHPDYTVYVDVVEADPDYFYSLNS